MRLLTYGRDARIGAVRGEDIVDVNAALDAHLDGTGEGMTELIRNWSKLRNEVERQLASGPSVGSLTSVELHPPVPAPGKILAAPVNYLDHQEEMNSRPTILDLGLFLKANTSVIGHGGTILLPYSDRRTDQEAELAVVIGRAGRRIDRRDALDHVFGYTCLLDITVRGEEERSTRKSFDTFTPLGPWIATCDEVGDPGDLELSCWVNGALRQRARTGSLIAGVEDLIAYASSIMTLLPGDIIATGTPAGVGPLEDGDTIAVEIGRVGRLEVCVSSQEAVRWSGVRPDAVNRAAS